MKLDKPCDLGFSFKHCMNNQRYYWISKDSYFDFHSKCEQICFMDDYNSLRIFYEFR